MTEILRLLRDYGNNIGDMMLTLTVYDDGSGRVENVQDEVLFYFNSISELEYRLTKGE